MSRAVPRRASSSDRAGSGLVRYFALALGATALLHGSLVVFGLGFSLDPSSPSSSLYLAGLAMPSLAAIVLSGRGARRSFLRSALAPRGALAVYGCGLLAQLGFVGLAWLLAAAAGHGVAPRLAPADGFVLLALGQVWVVLGEELGWRGYALPRLEALLSPRRATLVLAVLWGMWHAPMFCVAGSLQAEASPWLFAASIFAWSAVHTALSHRTRPSVLPNLVFHAAANITLDLGLVGPSLERYLLASYLAGGLAVLAALRPRGSGPAG